MTARSTQKFRREDEAFSQTIPIFEPEEAPYITHIRIHLPQELWYFIPSIRPQALDTGYNAPTIRAQITTLRYQLAQVNEKNSILIAAVNTLRDENRGERAMTDAAQRQNRALTADLAAAPAAPAAAGTAGGSGGGNEGVASARPRASAEADPFYHLNVPTMGQFEQGRGGEAQGRVREDRRGGLGDRVGRREGGGRPIQMGPLETFIRDGTAAGESAGDLARRLRFVEREFGREVRRNGELVAGITEERGRREEAEERLERERREAWDAVERLQKEVERITAELDAMETTAA